MFEIPDKCMIYTWDIWVITNILNWMNWDRAPYHYFYGWVRVGCLSGTGNKAISASIELNLLELNWLWIQAELGNRKCKSFIKNDEYSTYMNVLKYILHKIVWHSASILEKVKIGEHTLEAKDQHHLFFWTGMMGKLE